MAAGPRCLTATASRRRFAGQHLVLVDDVVVTGAHLRAAASFLNDCGATVRAAICAARASDQAPMAGAALTPSTFELREFESDPDWLVPEVIDGIEL